MNESRPTTSNQSRSFFNTPLLSCQILVYVEFMLFSGITIFLIIYQSEALLIGNQSWYYYFLVPILASIIMGVIFRLKATWQHGKMLIVGLQVSICIVNYVIVALLLYTDNLSHPQPDPVIFGFILLLLGLFLTNLIALSNQPIHANLRADNREFLSLMVAMGGAAVVIAFTIDLFATLTFFFIFSAIFHCAFCFFLIYAKNPLWRPREKVKRFQIVEKFFRFWFLLACLIITWDQLGFLYSPPDTIGGAYTYLFSSVSSPFFFGGILITPIHLRYKVTIYGDLGVCLLLFLSFSGIFITAPLVMGYILVSFALFLNESNSATNTLISTSALVGSLFGVYLFFNNAEVRVFEPHPFIFTVACGFLACVLILSMVFHFLHGKFEYKPAPNEESDKEMRRP